jgi:short-subunit dehydrogenase involved in D-alanine esterification of teichoic acids
MWHPAALVPTLACYFLLFMNVSTKKTILITGSTDGIGRLAAKKLSALGHHVIIHGRNQARIDRVVDETPGSFGIKGDLSDLSQVKNMADTIKSKYDKVRGRISPILGKSRRSGILRNAQQHIKLNFHPFSWLCLHID